MKFKFSDAVFYLRPTGTEVKSQKFLHSPRDIQISRLKLSGGIHIHTLFH